MFTLQPGIECASADGIIDHIHTVCNGLVNSAKDGRRLAAAIIRVANVTNPVADNIGIGCYTGYLHGNATDICILRIARRRRGDVRPARSNV